PQTDVTLYHITPDMSTTLIQEHLHTILQHIVTALPDRKPPVCCGVVFDEDSRNANGSLIQGYDVICPKPHIGPDVYDLVSRERHCLREPRLCHAIGQIII